MATLEVGLSAMATLEVGLQRVASYEPPEINRAEGEVIAPEEAETLHGLFAQRLARTPEGIACIDFDSAVQQWYPFEWREIALLVARWQAALWTEGLQPGDRVGLCLRNCHEWMVFDLAAQGLGLVTVPLYTSDRPGNMAYILSDSNCRLLLLERPQQWRALQPLLDELPELQRLVVLNGELDQADERVVSAAEWLQPHAEEAQLSLHRSGMDTLATIIYTSGTTGRPKGVMLSHANILHNAYNAQKLIPLYEGDRTLSFLPLSHTLERTCGYYLALMCGVTVGYNRSIAQLSEDLLSIKPTVLVAVPRIFEQVHDRIEARVKRQGGLTRTLFNLTQSVGWLRVLHQQGEAAWSPKLLLWPLLDRLVASKVRERVGGEMRLAICGGASLSPKIMRFFCSLGLNLIQGYGLTESSPVISANLPAANRPGSIGKPIRNVEVALSEEGELLARGPNIMLGYWNNPEATAQAVDAERWLHSGDQARVDEQGYLYITGRLKDVIVLANGEKVPPTDMELAIIEDPLFEQVLVVGENRPYLVALVVVEAGLWQALIDELGLPEGVERERALERKLLKRVRLALHEFPGYARIRRVQPLLKPWSSEEGLVTPTLKLKRNKVLQRHQVDIDRLYDSPLSQ